jgi:endo-1,4-beta-xylanase
MNRREALIHISSALAAGAVTSRTPAGDTAPALGPGKSLFGAQLGPDEVSQPLLQDLARRVCDIIVMAGGVYLGSVAKTEGVYDFRSADKILRFAMESHKLVRGHTLVWHESQPEWLGPLLAHQVNGRLFLASHIRTMVSRYQGQVRYWDVLNEIIQPSDGRSDGLRESPWLRALGPSYVVEALTTARQASPHALLGCNDFGIEDDSKGARTKRTALLRFLARMRSSHAPLDYLGVQGHLSEGQRYSSAQLGRFLRDVTDMGYGVHITELDVDDRRLPRDAVDRDRAVANLYDRFLDVVFQHISPAAVTTWGLSDLGSWHQQRHPREDGTLQRSLPFDIALRPKLAWNVIRSYGLGH